MHGFPIKDFGNDDYCSDYLLGLVLVLFVIQMHFVKNALDIFVLFILCLFYFNCGV